MFLCFYSIYGLLYTIFLVAWICDRYCESSDAQRLEGIGLQMVLVPFTVPGYLLNGFKFWDLWDGVSDEDFILETFAITFLCKSFYVDVLNSLWQFSRKYVLKDKDPIEALETTVSSTRNHLKEAFAKDISKSLLASIEDHSPIKRKDSLKKRNLRKNPQNERSHLTLPELDGSSRSSKSKQIIK